MSESPSPQPSDVIQEAQELNQMASSRMQKSHPALRGLLRRTQGRSFPSEEQGYCESFAVISRVQEMLIHGGLLPYLDEQSVFLTRRLPPLHRDGKVVFAIRRAKDLTLLKDTTAIPVLKARKPPEEQIAEVSFELVRQQCMEILRHRVLDLEGYKPESRTETKELIGEMNRLRGRYGAAFGYRENNASDISRVQMVFNNGSFQLRSTDASKRYFLSSATFPPLFVIDIHAV